MASKSKMGLGFLLGVVAGAVGGLFLAPKSGKENREAVAKKMKEVHEMVMSGEMKEKIQDIFGDLSDESVSMYTQARKNLLDGIEQMKQMDGDDYARLVQKIVDNATETGKATAAQLNRLKDSFIKDWPQMQKEAKEKGEKVKKEVSEKAQKAKKEAEVKSKLLAEKSSSAKASADKGKKD